MGSNTSGIQFVVIALHHGGDLHAAAKRYGIPIDNWQDLSTGISPWSWPVPSIPTSLWNRLPNDCELMTAARQYYNVSDAILLAVAGSQVAIRHIPTALSASKVAIPLIGYQEHRYSWQQVGHQIVDYSSWSELLTLVESQSVDHVVVINPNNPTGQRFSRNQLLSLRSNMHDHQLLLVDEAFADFDPSESLASNCFIPGVVILRSVGKFFGLAGIRLGFAMGNHSVLDHLSSITQPWPVSAPAAYIGSRALLDTQWQNQQRINVAKLVSQLHQVVEKRFADMRILNGGLFVTVIGESAILKASYDAAAKAGILLRYDDISSKLAWLRIGLADDNYERLKKLWFDK